MLHDSIVDDFIDNYTSSETYIKVRDAIRISRRVLIFILLNYFAVTVLDLLDLFNSYVDCEIGYLVGSILLKLGAIIIMVIQWVEYDNDQSNIELLLEYYYSREQQQFTNWHDLDRNIAQFVSFRDFLFNTLTTGFIVVISYYDFLFGIYFLFNQNEQTIFQVTILLSMIPSILFQLIIFIISILAFILFLLFLIANILILVAGIFILLPYLIRNHRMRQQRIQEFQSSPLNNVVDIPLEECCAICLQEYQADQSVKCLPCSPKHYFHEDCLVVWLQDRQTCPICRASI